MGRQKCSIDWLSKGIDLVIVILGITIAFNLNSWNAAQQDGKVQQEYLKSLLEESQQNKTSLQGSLDFCEGQRRKIDTLLRVLSSAESEAAEIKAYSIRMLVTEGGLRYTSAMDNITYSGDFSLIGGRGLRKQVVTTYRYFEELDNLEELSVGFVRNYFGPLLLENRDDAQLESAAFRSEMAYLALIYAGSVQQQADGYEEALGLIEYLMAELESQLAN